MIVFVYSPVIVPSRHVVYPDPNQCDHDQHKIDLELVAFFPIHLPCSRFRFGCFQVLLVVDRFHLGTFQSAKEVK